MAAPKGNAVARQVPALKTVTGSSLALAEDIDAEKVAAQLAPVQSGAIAEQARAFQEMLEMPYVSARAIAEAGTLFTILNAAESEVEAIGGKGEMVAQVVFMVALQGELQYEDSTGKVHDHLPGDLVLIGQRRGRVRDTWLGIAQRAHAAGERLVNFQCYKRPSTLAGYAPAIAFRQVTGS